jgi:hypothetical protein
MQFSGTRRFSHPLEGEKGISARIRDNPFCERALYTLSRWEREWNKCLLYKRLQINLAHVGTGLQRGARSASRRLAVRPDRLMSNAVRCS